jgi:hypothetical protein
MSMPVVDLSFRLLGKSIPADHGYVLYGALSGIVRAIHNSAGFRGFRGHIT